MEKPLEIRTMEDPSIDLLAATVEGGKIMDTVKFKEMFGRDEEDFGQHLFDVYLKPVVNFDDILSFLRCLQRGGEGAIPTSAAFCHHGGDLGSALRLDPAETNALLNTAFVQRARACSLPRSEGLVLTDAGRRFLALFDSSPDYVCTVRVDGEVFPWAGREGDSLDPSAILGEYGRVARFPESVTLCGPYPIDQVSRLPGEAFLLYRFGPRIITSWFSEAINPLLRALKTENEYLRTENWTWEWQSRELDSIRPLRDHLDDEAVDILEQFLSNHPNVVTKMVAHDEGVQHLLEKCQALHDSLVKSSSLRKVYESAVSEAGLKEIGMSLAQIFGAYREPSAHLEIISQYIVNNRVTLPAYYPTSHFWRRHGKAFMRILDEPSIRDRGNLAIEAGKELLEAEEHLTDTLKSTREYLSRENDVPVAHGDLA